MQTVLQSKARNIADTIHKCVKLSGTDISKTCGASSGSSLHMKLMISYWNQLCFPRDVARISGTAMPSKACPRSASSVPQLTSGAKTPAKVGVEGTVDEPCFGKHAVTRYSVDESFSSPSFPSPPMDPPIDPPIDPSIELEDGLREGELRFHLLKLKPETGRKHQLRLHCSHSLGMPIVGDSLYDNQSEIAKALRVAGLFLHASSLQMKHPVYTSRPEEIGVVLGRQGSRCCIRGLIMAHMTIYGNNH